MLLRQLFHEQNNNFKTLFLEKLITILRFYLLKNSDTIEENPTNDPNLFHFFYNSFVTNR